MAVVAEDPVDVESQSVGPELAQGAQIEVVAVQVSPQPVAQALDLDAADSTGQITSMLGSLPEHSDSHSGCGAAPRGPVGSCAEPLVLRDEPIDVGEELLERPEAP